MNLCLLAFEPFTILAILSLISSVAMTVIAANKQPAEAEEGSQLGLVNNKADPGDPVPMVFGAPRWTPPALAREIGLSDHTTGQGVLNIFNGTNILLRSTLLFDTGIGPMDGSDLNVWLNDVPAFEVVNEVTNPGSRRLLPVTGALPARTRFWFPKRGVERIGAEIYLDGVLYGVSRGTDLTTYPTTHVTAAPAVREISIKGKTYSFIEADEKWDVENATFVIKRESFKSTPIPFWPTGTYDYITVPLNECVRRETLFEPGSFGTKPINALVFDESIEPQKKTGSSYRREWVVRHVTVIVEKVQFAQFFDVVTDEKSQVSEAVFKYPVPDGKLEANYRSLPLGDDTAVTTVFTKGELDQLPPVTSLFGGSTQTSVVGSPITNTALVNYTTTIPVQDALLLISSGNGGFWNLKSNGPDWYTAAIGIRIRAEGAPDQPAPEYGPNAFDPARGWVRLKYGGLTVLPLTAKVQSGYARWQFRLSDGVWNNLPETKPRPDRLPQSKYEVEITRFTPVAADADGARELFLEAVTEKTFDIYTFPGRSFLRVDYLESEALKNEPKVDVQFRAMKVHVVTGFDGKGDPVFAVKWSRNPVWIACELVLNRMAGGGTGGNGIASINWQSAAAAAAYCDEIVSFGGTSGVRSEADFVVVRQTNLFTAATDVLAGSGVSPIFLKGKWAFPFDADERVPVTDPLTSLPFEISDADILDSEDDSEVDGLSFERKPIEKTATDLHITFPDEEADFDKDADPVYIPIEQDDVLIRRILKTDLPAVRRRWQAERIGRRLAEDEVANTRFAMIRMNNLRALSLEPGDVIMVGSVSAQLPTQKALVIEHTAGGSNGRMEIKVLLLGKLTANLSASTPTSLAGYTPRGSVVPGTREPSSYILKVEEL